MGSIRVRPSTGRLFFDFRFKGVRCREQTALEDTPANRKKMKQMLDRIEAEITLGTFDYLRYFPDSTLAQGFVVKPSAPVSSTPLFKEFAALWLAEMSVEWRKTHIDTVTLSLDKYILPTFGEKPVGDITKAEILDFRRVLASVPGRKGRPLSPSRINHIMTPLRMILNEAANRHGFGSPYAGIKSMKVPRTDVEPFTLEEVKLILDSVRADFRNYFLVRFFTGLRTSEVDGLLWQHVDFDRRQILVRQAWVGGEMVYTKNDGSYRSVDMSTLVHDALVAQKKVTGHLNYVFCNSEGNPLNHNNVTNRVWYPLLRHLGLRLRRPYQSRHTAATLWLASGENVEWIARQMGHTTTEMLFRVYSRFVPNLTRKDGSAFERVLAAHLGSGGVQ